MVPTRDSARTIESCLGSLRAQTHPDVEVIVVDNHSTDPTGALAARYADIVAERGPERCAQRNHGTAVSTGEVVVPLAVTFRMAACVMNPPRAESLGKGVRRRATPRTGCKP